MATDRRLGEPRIAETLRDGPGTASCFMRLLSGGAADTSLAATEWLPSASAIAEATFM